MPQPTESMRIREKSPAEQWDEIKKIGAVEYSKDKIVQKVLMHPLSMEKLFWERQLVLDKLRFGRNHEDNLLIKLCLETIEMEGQMIAIHGREPGKLAVDPYTQMVMAVGNKNINHGQHSYYTRQEPDILERETSINEERGAKQAAKNKMERLDELAAAKREIATLKRDKRDADYLPPDDRENIEPDIQEDEPED